MPSAAPQSWNLYAYVRGNPTNSVDPAGKVTLVFTVTHGSNLKEKFGHSAVFVFSRTGNAAGVSLGGEYGFEKGVAEFVRHYNAQSRTVLLTVLNTTPAQDARMIDFPPLQS